jgi:branched-chain amino acid transport system substrate-binding protein
VIIVAALAVFFILKSTKEGPIKIGAVLSISGPGSQTGKDIKDGVLLAVDEINSWGGINGRKIELIIEDSKTNPQQGKKSFNKIETAHHPVLYVSTLSSVSMALAPLAGKNEVVLVGLAVTALKFTQHNEWVFRYFPTPEIEVPPILSILQDLKIKQLGILYQNDEYGTSVFKLLKKEFEKTGGAVRAEAFDLKGSDFKPQITKLKDREAIYSVGFSTRLKNVIKQLKEEDFKGFLLASNSAARPSIIGMPEANGVYAAAPVVYNPNYLLAKDAEEKYEARYDKPFNHIAANGYDFIKLLAGLLEDKEVSRESIKSLLEEGFIYSGAFGSIDVKPGEHDITFPLHPAQIVDGEIKYLR